jgi:hypothetical protein
MGGMDVVVYENDYKGSEKYLKMAILKVTYIHQN